MLQSKIDDLKGFQRDCNEIMSKRIGEREERDLIKTLEQKRLLVKKIKTIKS